MCGLKNDRKWDSAWIVQNVGKRTCPSAVVLVKVCRHATRDAAIFLWPVKSTGANRSFFAFEKLPIKMESAREREYYRDALERKSATLHHNYSFWQLLFPVPNGTLLSAEK